MKGWIKTGQFKDQIHYKHNSGTIAIVTVEVHEDKKKWLHVSISRRNKLPTWEHLKDAKETFIGKDKMAVQILPPAAEYVNLHPNCLHLWHCLEGKTI